MATSAFKSTTKRAPIGGGSSSGRRSRSLSRFSRPIAPQHQNASNEKFVNAERGSSTASFQDISLDDLALEFFSSSSLNDNESEGGGGGGERERKSVIRRRASDTACSSRRRGRSMSRSRGDDVSASEAKNVNSSNAGGSRRRRSLSVARYRHISDSESEVDLSRNSSNRANGKAPICANGRTSLVTKATTSSNRQLGRSRSHKDLHVLHDGYSSHSSAKTDEESKGENGFEKIIRAVYARNKAERPSEDVANGGLYEEMRKELKYAVQEIRTEINQAIGRNHTALTSGGCFLSDNSNALRDFSRTRNGYATKLEQLQVENRKNELLTERLVKDQTGRQFSKNIKELHNSRSSALVGRPSRARKRSTDRNGMSKRFTEEAERYFEDFISNVEDTDISSFDGERSDGSSTIGFTMKARDYVIREADKSPTVSSSHPVEMDDVALPWLQWDTNDDGFLSVKNKTQTPVTAKALNWGSEKDIAVFQDPSSYSTSSYSSWTSGIFNSPMINREDTGKTIQVDDESSNFHMEEYLRLRKNEELLFEMYQEQNRINLGGLLLCTGALY